MNEMKKINEMSLENVVGGARRVVYNDHAGYPYANCRRTPGLESEVFSRFRTEQRLKLPGM